MILTLEGLLELAKTGEGKLLIREEVAKLCGYEKHPVENCWYGFSEGTPCENREDTVAGFNRRTQQLERIPRYDTSLDAILPEARSLIFSRRQRYLWHLNRVLSHPLKGPRIADQEMVFAEAIHHCIAFVLTEQKD